jgi:hypothetical protein
MLLPLNASGGTQMTGNDRYEPDTAACTGWQLSKIDCTKTAGIVQIKIRGKYDQAEGTYTIKIDNTARMTVDYEFTSTGKLNPRQLGIVFDVADVCDTLTWNRNAIWTTYPDDHIGRPAGSAKAFVGTEISASAGPRIAPDWPWSHDCNKMGTNDFRGTKQNIYWASLTASDESGLLIRSDGTQSTRAWVENDRIRLLVADYINAGAERFFRSHAAVEDKPLNTADIIKGRTKLELLRPNSKEPTK